jgi:5-formyltetrahydrofolate cyclo-ligase
MTKQELRKIYLSKRLSLSDSEYRNLSELIAENFFAQVDLSQVQVLHTFLPIEKNKEPDTWLIIARLRKEFPAINISIPRINTQTSLLDNFYYEGPDQLEKNTWGIPEPKHGLPTPNEKINAVLVPLLAIDQAGHRVGYGRGFYDKFLSQCPPSVMKIGLSFFPPVEKIKDVHQHDYTLTHAVTPECVYNFTN